MRPKAARPVTTDQECGYPPIGDVSGVSCDDKIDNDPDRGYTRASDNYIAGRSFEATWIGHA